MYDRINTHEIIYWVEAKAWCSASKIGDIYMMKKILSILLIMLSRGLVAAMPEPLNREWGFSERQGQRETMEDAFFHEMIEVSTGIKYPCFGLFDGHGGPHASKLAAEQFQHYSRPW